MEALSPAGALPPLTAIMEIEFGVKIAFGVIITAELELILRMKLYPSDEVKSLRDWS